jgi:hypothetical protein
MKYIILILGMLASAVNAHEMTPTYPKLTPSSYEGIYKTTMNMFNKRADIQYYEVGVFNKDFKVVPFVTSYSVIKINYLSHVTFDIYVREEDLANAVYICSQSKIKTEDITRTAISSRICSKFKND